MRNSLPNFFSYLFMTAALIALFSAFGMIIIFLRSYVMSINDLEQRTGYILLYIFIISLILAPTFLYISDKLEKIDSSS
jgi:sensor histidine kinase YesM